MNYTSDLQEKHSPVACPHSPLQHQELMMLFMFLKTYKKVQLNSKCKVFVWKGL